jgi:transposase
MTKMTQHTIGIDISESHLDVFRLEDGEAKRFENSPRGFRALIKWLDVALVARIVFEPTGPYHRAFEEALSPKFSLVKVNPFKVRRFAEACGTRAKTYAVDARTLARMGAALKLEPDQPAPRKLLEIQDLQIARIGLIKERTRLRERGHTQTNQVPKRHASPWRNVRSRNSTRKSQSTLQRINPQHARTTSSAPYRAWPRSQPQ